MSEANAQEEKLTLRQALELGMQLQRGGRLSEAEDIYRQVLSALPEQPDALHFLGLLAHQLGRGPQAVEFLTRALAAAPGHFDAQNNLGNVLKELGRLEEAEAAFRRAIELSPDHAGAHNNLGVVLKERGDVAGAVACYERAVTLEPGRAETHLNLGNARCAQDQLEAAVAAYENAVRLQPDLAEAHYNLGRALASLGRREDAISALRQTTALHSKHAAAHLELGASLAVGGLLGDAVEAFRKALECDPKLLPAYKNLGNMLNMLGRREEAQEVWRRWLEQDPESPVARHMLAAMSGEGVPARAADAFVRETFDNFARTFDERLTQLRYQAPALIAEAIALELGPATGALAVLDAGCGTGLCAPLLRPYARTLTGVDLSAGMLDKARERGGYDELVAGELTEFLGAAASRFDLIASADTLVYFGDLSAVLHAGCDALRPNGVLSFTAERLETGSGQGFQLHAWGRYSHTEEYLRAQLGEAGLRVCRMNVADLRMELGQPVSGWVVTARRSGD